MTPPLRYSTTTSICYWWKLPFYWPNRGNPQTSSYQGTSPGYEVRDQRARPGTYYLPVVIGHKVTNYSAIVLRMWANNLWNDTPSEVINHYQQLVHKVLQVNSRCQVLLSGLLPRAQDFYPGNNINIQILVKVLYLRMTCNQNTVRHV
jgi:hypothetical protein